MRPVKPNANDQMKLYEDIKDLKQLLERLRKAQESELDLPIWILENAEVTKARGGKILKDYTFEGASRMIALSVHQQLEYSGSQEASKSILLPGIMAVTAKSLDLIEQINQLKQRIKGFCGALDGQYVYKKDLDDPAQMPGAYSRMPYSNYLFHKIGMSRIHRVQLYRAITVLERRPKRLGFTWAHTRRVQNRSREDVLKILERLGSSADSDRTKIENVADEQFAIVSETQVNARANLVYDMDGKEKRVQKTLAMPMVYLQEDDLPLPPCGQLSVDASPNTYRLPRVKDRIEDQPFIKEIPVYRYRQVAS